MNTDPNQLLENWEKSDGWTKHSMVRAEGYELVDALLKAQEAKTREEEREIAEKEILGLLKYYEDSGLQYPHIPFKIKLEEKIERRKVLKMIEEQKDSKF